jgi:hypothetical protein
VLRDLVSQLGVSSFRFIEVPEATMKSSGLITGVTLMQFLLGLLCVGVSIFLLVLIRSAGIRQANDAAAVISGLKIAAGVIGPPGLLALVGAYGMRKDRLWGWWVSLLVDFGAASILACGVIADGWKNLDPELIILTLGFAMPVVLLLLPSVRRFYRGSSSVLLGTPMP